MILSIRRDQLRQAVQGLGKIISTRCTLPVLKCVRIDADEREVVAQATDLDSIATYRFADATVRGNGTFITQLQPLKELAKGAGSDLVEFETGGTGRVQITTTAGGQPLQRSLPTVEPEEWPNTRMDVDTSPVPGFLDVYRRLQSFASRDTTRYVLNGVCLDVGGKGPNAGIMIATDGRRLARQNGLSLPFPETCILRLSKFLAWKKLPADVEVGFDSVKDVNWIGIDAGDWTFRTRAIEGSYPAWRQVLPSEPGGRRISLTEQDVDILREAVPSLPGEEVITLAGSGGRVTVWAKGPEDPDWTTLELPHATYEGKAGHISLNRKYVEEALAAGFMRSMRFADELSPVYSEDSEGGLHLLMSMRAEVPEGIAEAAAKSGNQSESSTVLGESPADTTPPATSPTPASPDGPSKKNQDVPKKEPSPSTHPEPTRRKSPMSEKNTKPDELATFAELQAAAGDIKSKVQETKTAVTRLTTAVKAAMRDARQQRAEVDAARATLSKLKAIDL